MDPALRSVNRVDEQGYDSFDIMSDRITGLHKLRGELTNIDRLDYGLRESYGVGSSHYTASRVGTARSTCCESAPSVKAAKTVDAGRTHWLHI